MNRPTAKEINPFDCLDGQCADRNFLGKSLEDAEALFRENSLYYQEDLMFMGPVAFRFYVNAAINYLRSDAATGDSNMASCFESILGLRLDQEANELIAIADSLASICAYVLENYDRFDLEPEVYGNLRPRYRKLEQAFLELASRAGARKV